MGVELRPSAAATWYNCPGSINFTAKAEPDVGSIFAAEGTAAHTVRELCLEFGLDAHHFLGHQFRVDGHLFTVDEDWVEALQPGLDRINEFEGEMFIEQPMNLSPWLHGRTGTLDLGLIGRKLIVISDLKFGRGVPVSPVNNLQQVIYALAFWKRHAKRLSDATDFLIIIDQPRNAEGGGEWRVSLDELLEIGETIEDKVNLTREKNAPRIAGEKQCFWCPGKNMGCPEYEKFNLDLLSLELPDLDDECGEPPLPDGMTPKRRSYLLKHRGMIVDWLDRHHSQAIADALHGRPTPGLKAVYGKKKAARWTDPVKAELTLKKNLSAKDIFTKKLITPAKLKGLDPKVYRLASDFMERGDPNPVLVSELDDREAIQNYADQLPDLTDED